MKCLASAIVLALAVSLLLTGCPNLPEIYIIHSTAGEKGKIIPAGTTKVQSGFSQIFHIIPEKGYEIDEVLVDGALVDVTPVYAFQNVSAEHSIHATFFRNQKNALRKILLNDQEDIDLRKWIAAEGETFSFMIPLCFSVDFTMVTGFEVADLGFEGIIVAKLLAGLSEGTEPILDLLNNLVASFLGTFGDFEILDHRQETYLAYFSVNLFTLDFSGQSCWIVVCSESLNPDIFGIGEYIVFIGLLEDDNKAEMVDWYRGMMLTVDSDFLAH